MPVGYCRPECSMSITNVVGWRGKWVMLLTEMIMEESVTVLNHDR